MIGKSLEDGNKENYHWAMGLAEDIKDFSATQKITAKKFIRDVVYYTSMDMLKPTFSFNF